MAKDTYITGFKWLGIYQVIGGLSGFCFTVPVLFQMSYDLLTIALVALAIGLQFFSFYCGIQLLRSQKYSLEISLVCQWLQAISLSGSFVSFRYLAGLAIYIGADISNGFSILLDGSISTFEWALDTSLKLGILYVNPIALAFIFIINHERKAIDRDKENDLFNSIAK